MKVDAFDFELPPACIAQRPASPRDAARLLHVGADGGLADHGVRDLPRLLRPGDLLVVNDTRVIPARLFGTRRREGDAGPGAKVEVTLHLRLAPGVWEAFAKPARRLRPGDRIEFNGRLAATIEARGEGGAVRLAFGLDDAGLMAALERLGAMPLPPYIRRGRGPDPQDRRDYQTLFAEKPGAVAAPTAGLHFTPGLLGALGAAGIGMVRLTLHVGAGTFLPVTAADTAGHRMHAEWGCIGDAAAARINDVRSAGGRIVAVGSTALRLLETAADDDGRVSAFAGTTDIFIVPGFRFRIADLLITNFHLPRSTLFMLVSAFSGLDRMKRAYAHAIDAGYRFYSYGDCCLLEAAGEIREGNG